MAADRPLTERRIVEIKMGRSKFPGKPSKIGNRKRVNLSSCALPEENDSSKAAENIYLGLSVFNETFGDNEMVEPGPFHGFSMLEVEEAMAGARLQQREAELEHERQGIRINLWEEFQNELFSISHCSKDKTTGEFNKTKLCFDGGGSATSKESSSAFIDVSETKPSTEHNFRNSQSSPKTINCCKKIDISVTQDLKLFQSVNYATPSIKLFKLPISPNGIKSLQSKAAKKLLEKAKKSNLFDSIKNHAAERKFVLPSRSLHSSRVITPNKRFLQEEDGRRQKLLRSRAIKIGITSGLIKSSKKYMEEKGSKLKSSSESTCSAESKADIEDKKKPVNKKENTADTTILDQFSVKASEEKGKSKPMQELPKSIAQTSTSGKVILREARLQLDSNNLSLMEGPFSSSNASSLSPNSQLKMNPVQSVASPGTIICGVCGGVRFYRLVRTTKKFGVHCCEPCKKFITKMIKFIRSNISAKLQCQKGNGLCSVPAIVRSKHWNLGKCTYKTRCDACWLKLCLRSFKLPSQLKQQLLKLLPSDMRLKFTWDSSLIVSKDISNKFVVGDDNIKDFKWLHENSSTSTESKSNIKSSFGGNKASQIEQNSSNISRSKDETQRRKGLRTESKKTNDKSRQSVDLKGPRVKHVCRSASVVLGQPIATFPGERSPTKKQVSDLTDDCKNCDTLDTTSSGTESQGAVDKSAKDLVLNDVKQGVTEKKCNISSKIVSIVKSSGLIKQNATKSKKNGNIKPENMISMDFWESYDPDEVCETGFGLIGSEACTSRSLCFLCGSSGLEKLIHCASCGEPYHEFCVDEGQLKLEDGVWRYDWVCPRCTICVTCGKSSGQQLKCIRCDNTYHAECIDRVGGRLLHSPDRPWVCSVCLRCKSCNGIDVSVFVGNLPLCKTCFLLRQKGNYCPLCQRCYEDDDYDSKMMECGQCRCWVHAKCEGLSDEKYQVLSFLPESVEYICRMCCVMPPAPWWIAVESELKSGYLGVLKSLSKNRKACTMLKWSPRKQCTCRQVSCVPRTIDFEESKNTKNASEKNSDENPCRISKTSSESEADSEEKSEERIRPAMVTERKTSIEVINHPTESLKLTLKIMKGPECEERSKTSEVRSEEEGSSMNKTRNVDKTNNKETHLKKCLSNEENSMDSSNSFYCHDDSQTSLQSLYKNGEYAVSAGYQPDKRSLSSPLNTHSDSGIGSTDDELKANCLTDEETCRLDDPQSQKCITRTSTDTRSNEVSTLFLDEKRECFCFLEEDSYNSRSKPFSPNLLSIKKKVTTSEYSSLHQFHQDMQSMIGTTQSSELMEVYYQAIKEIFPWFDPKFSKVYNNSQKVFASGSTPVKNTPTKKHDKSECTIPKEKLIGQPLDYFYSDYTVEDTRMCLMCKNIGDGPPADTGRLIYCGQNEWVHCNCALWSGEVFEEIDGSLQNVHSAINRGRSIRCPECNLKGASIGCCARNCQETYHFGCARKIGCIFMDDKTVYCPVHASESAGKLVQNEKEFEIRRPVYVELDKRKTKMADSNHVRFTVGSLHVENIGKFVLKLSDQPEAIIPAEFQCMRWFWSCFEPWRVVRYHFSVRLLEVEQNEGVDLGVNLTVDHSEEPELVDLKLKQLKYFQDCHQLLEINQKLVEEKKKLNSIKFTDDFSRSKCDDMKMTPFKRPKKEEKVVRKIFDNLDSKDDENCLSDNQNTADLLPPDIEEAIFEDLPHDILDGISMQDIFMDIRNEPFEQGDKETKDEINEDSAEAELISADNQTTDKNKKSDFNEVVGAANCDYWALSNESKCANEAMDEFLLNSKLAIELKRSKSDVLPNQTAKKNALKTHQRSCSLNWNCKMDVSPSKWKRNPKCHVTVNLLDAQDRVNMLQELKLADGLVSVSTGALDSVKELRARLDESRRSIQQEEGKENKCLPWHARLQPRLLQVDGGVDSSSSGSEAGESPQRFIDENLCGSRNVLPPQTSPYSSTLIGPPSIPSCSSPTANPCVNMQSTLYPTFSDSNPDSSACVSLMASDINLSLPQIDGANDSSSDCSDIEELSPRIRKIPVRLDQSYLPDCARPIRTYSFRIPQCDGSADSDAEGGVTSKRLSEESSLKDDDDLGLPLEISVTKDEPVKCSQCHCTYRTKISYQRHLENCCNDFMLSSSEGEMSGDEEGSKKQPEEIAQPVRPAKAPSNPEVNSYEKVRKETPIVPSITVPMPVTSNFNGNLTLPNLAKKNVVKKPKLAKPRVVLNKQNINSFIQRPVAPVPNRQPVQPILLHQQNGIPPALIVQDVPRQNVVPTAFLEPTPTLQYVAAIDQQNAFAKPQLIAANPLMSGGFHIQSSAESQLLGGLSVLPQNIQSNMSGIIIQPPHPTGTLISSQPGPILMAGDQPMMLGSSPMYEVIQDPQTGGMFLTSHNQPLFYNMETIVSNTVMQTNQYVSNVMATSSYSQTSTQVFQASKLEQVVNVPPNFFVVAPPTASVRDELMSNNIICLQNPNSLITNPNPNPAQTPVQLSNQTMVPSLVRPQQTFNAQPKIITSQPATLRCIQPNNTKQLPVNQTLLPTVVNTVRSTAPMVALQNCTPKVTVSNRMDHQVVPKSLPPKQNVVKPKPKTYEKPNKNRPVKPRICALVDYINNFKSDTCDISGPISPTPVNTRIDIDIPPSQNSTPLQVTNGINCALPPNFPKQNNNLMTYSATTKKKKNQMPLVISLPAMNNRYNFKESVCPQTSLATSYATSYVTSTAPLETRNSECFVVPVSTVPQTVPLQNSVPSYSINVSAPVRMPVQVEKPPVVVAPKRVGLCPTQSLRETQSWPSKIVTNAVKANMVTASVNASVSASAPLICTAPVITKESAVTSSTTTNTISISDNLLPLTNRALKPVPYDRELKLSINMPSLDDSPPTSEVDVSQPAIKNIVESEKIAAAPTLLPLKDNYQSINSKNLAKLSPHNGTQLPLNNSKNLVVAEEKTKVKKKVDSPYQNCLATKLVTIHPRLIQQEQILPEKSKTGKLHSSKVEEKGPKLIFDVTSDDGFKCSSTSMVELWANICDSVQEMRAVFKIPSLPLSRKGHEILGMQNHGLQHCLEQLRGAEQCIRYKCKYFLKEDTQKGDDDCMTPAKENLTGSARTESFVQRKEHDIFAWLASRHRKLPKLKESVEESLVSNRRANSLPMAMRYRILRETSKFYVGVYRSKIHGKGLFCLREIEAGEMVIEYAGEVIRANLTDKREKYYTDKGIGCYMFRIDDHFVVDATMKGNAARFINHSCEPNCYSRVVDILGKKHIVIFALRRINIMEELTYDYKFPFEDEKISCHCLSKKCRKYLN